MSAQAPTGAPRATDRSGRPLRVAVVGLGLIGRQRAEALARIEGATLAATVDPFQQGLGEGTASASAAGHAGGAQAARTGDAGAGMADTWVTSASTVGTRSALRHAVLVTTGVPHYTTLAELPPESYDAAVVAVPHDRAPALAASVLEQGKPILIEKPLGMSAREARRLEALADGLQAPSFVGYNYRFLPAIAELLRQARTGALGELRNVDLLVGHGGHPDSAKGWKLDPARAGGGVLLDPGVHLLDLLLRVAPQASCTGIEATRGFWGTGIEEDVVATFRAGQLIATVRVSHVRWVNTFQLEVFGESAYALAEGRGGNYGAMTLRVGRRWGWNEPGAASQRASETVHEFGARNDSLRDELAAVVARWRGGPVKDAAPGAQAEDPQPATMSEARRVTELCGQLYPQIGGRGDVT